MNRTNYQWRADIFGSPDQCADSSPQCNVGESAVTLETRLAAAIGADVVEALSREGLVLVERGSTEDLWRDALRRAAHTDLASVPALIDVGVRNGWVG